MEQQLQLFEHEQFGKIRVIMIEGDPWFVAVDVCRALGLTNVTKTLLTLDNDEKQSVTLPNDVSKDGVTNTVINEGINGTLSGWIENRVNVINEPGLYRLVMRSRKPSAIKFQRWICHEVLPLLRKTGSYSLEEIVTQLLKSADGAQIVYKCVYVLLMNNNSVKIGYTQDFERRARQIETGSGLTVVYSYHTEYFPEVVARLIEWACKEKFSFQRIKGEFFAISFEEACAAVDAFAKAVNTLASMEPEKILVLASKDNVKLIADRN